MISRERLLPAIHDSQELISKPPKTDAMLFWQMPKGPCALDMSKAAGGTQESTTPASNGQHYKAKAAMADQRHYVCRAAS